MTETKKSSHPLPAAVARQAEEVISLTGAFCSAHLDAEYAELCRKLVGKLARKKSSPLARGDVRIWAAAVIHTIGKVNFLFDPTQAPHMTADELARLTGTVKNTVSAKSTLICPA